MQIIMSKDEKIKLAVIGVQVVGGLVGVAWCYAKTQYYQGRIDARREMSEKLADVMMNVIIERSKHDKEEA